MSAGEPAGPEAAVASTLERPSLRGRRRRTDPSRRARLNPYILGYAMGPAALATLLFLRHFGVVAHVPVWLWLVVFAAIPAGSIGLEFAVPPPPEHRLAQRPGGLARRGGDRGHLPERVGPGAHRGLRLRGTRERLPRRVAHVAAHGAVEPPRHRRGSGGHLAALGALVPLGRQERGPRAHGRVRAPVRHPHGRGDDRAERGRRDLHARERRAFPLPRPELHRHHLRHGRRGAHPLRRARPRSRCSAGTPRTSSACGPPSSSIPRTGPASRRSSPRWSTP